MNKKVKTNPKISKKMSNKPHLIGYKTQETISRSAEDINDAMALICEINNNLSDLHTKDKAFEVYKLLSRTIRRLEGNGAPTRPE